MSILSYGPIYKPILQVSMIFGSNFKKKKNLAYLIILFLFSGVFVSIYQMVNSNIPYLIRQEAFFDTARAYASFYRTENKDNGFLLTPEIPSDIIDSKAIRLFIPVFNHEKRMRKNICDTYTKDPDKSEAEQRKERRANQLSCYRQYNHVFLNGEEMKVDFLRFTHPRTNQFGIICYLASSNFKQGMNRLEVKKLYGDDNDVEWSIPFYYGG